MSRKSNRVCTHFSSQHLELAWMSCLLSKQRFLLSQWSKYIKFPLIVLTIDPRIVNKFWSRTPISFKHTSFWRPHLDPYVTTHHPTTSFWLKRIARRRWNCGSVHPEGFSNAGNLDYMVMYLQWKLKLLIIDKMSIVYSSLWTTSVSVMAPAELRSSFEIDGITLEFCCVSCMRMPFVPRLTDQGCLCYIINWDWRCCCVWRCAMYAWQETM